MIAQILAVIIFLAMFILIITEVWERHIVTLGCALLTLVVIFGICMHSPSAIIDTLNLKTFFTEAFWHTTGQASESSGGINWETIVFIAGMMIMVEGMAKSGFFRWLCMKIAKMVKYQIIPIFITFMVLSFVLAMFIDSITVILFLAAVTVELSQLLKFNPVPMILSEIFCANLGGSATMCGDPPNIIIGTSLGMSFSDRNCKSCCSCDLFLSGIQKGTGLQCRHKESGRLSGSFRGYHQQGWICDQLDHLPVCSGSSGNTFTDRTYRIMHWSIHCSCHIAYSRKRCTGSSEKSRL